MAPVTDFAVKEKYTYFNGLSNYHEYGFPAQQPVILHGNANNMPTCQKRSQAPRL